MSARLLALLATLAAAGVTCRSMDSAPASPWTDSAGGIADPALAAAAGRLWEEALAADPVWAGQLGDERFLGALPDLTPRGRQARRERLEALAQELASLEPARLGAADRVTLSLARTEVANALTFLDADFIAWNVDPRGAPHVELWNLAPDQPASTATERALLLQRWQAMAGLVDAAAGHLQRGAREGRIANRTSIERTLEQLHRILGQPIADWPVARLALPAGLPALEQRTFTERVERLLEEELRPALGRYRQTLDSLLPFARGDELPGLAGLAGGPELYARLIQVHTSLPLEASEVHAQGLADVAAVRAEMEALGQKLFGLGDLAALRERLFSDPALMFSSRDEVEETARAALAAARQAMPRWFGRLPRADCIVVRIEPHEEQETTIAYYRQPAADGSLPGRYFINTFAPETRPRMQAEVLAFHEAIPGHHLQIAIAQELEGVPLFQRHLGCTAYVEGWALYTERLCDEMGLYGSDLDRLGMLSFDAWRACRLVVDTGLHALGWSRQRALDYMRSNTLLEEPNIENEVDRYITSPGQALAYKTGQREILRLRALAEERLGTRFSLPDFHDVVLERGAVTLPVLTRSVEDWIAAQP